MTTTLRLVLGPDCAVIALLQIDATTGEAIAIPIIGSVNGGPGGKEAPKEERLRIARDALAAASSRKSKRPSL